MNSDNSINVIHLQEKGLEAPFISSGALSIIRDTERMGKKALLFYNRRGTARAWLCQDCGHYEKCPFCDIAFAYHTTPKKRLVCHQCNHEKPFPLICPNCSGSTIVGVGIGIQRIASDLERLLPDMHLLRIDSDNTRSIREAYDVIDQSDIILTTALGSTLSHPDIGVVIFLSFEMNLSIPEYDIEEQIFDEILYYKKQGLPIHIQTYIPDHPLLREILYGNQKSFFEILSEERKKFQYPPFCELATIRVHDENQEKVTRMMHHLIQKIQSMQGDGVFFMADNDIWERHGGEWSQKIILKGHELSRVILSLEIEVVRNRSVSLEWN